MKVNQWISAPWTPSDIEESENSSWNGTAEFWDDGPVARFWWNQQKHGPQMIRSDDYVHSTPHCFVKVKDRHIDWSARKPEHVWKWSIRLFEAMFLHKTRVKIGFQHLERQINSGARREAPCLGFKCLPETLHPNRHFRQRSQSRASGFCKKSDILIRPMVIRLSGKPELWKLFPSSPGLV